MFRPNELPAILYWPQGRSVYLRYSSPIAATIVAASCTYLIWPLINPAVSLLFFIAVLYSSWYGGLRPGLLCSALSTLACNYLYVAPLGSVHFGADDLLRLAVFMMAAVIVSSLTLSRQMADAAKVKAEKHLQITFRSMGHAVISTDAHGRVVSMNSVAQSLTGWKQQDARGRKLQDLFQIVDAETHAEMEMVVSRVARENAVIGLGNSVLMITRDGSEIPINEIATPLRDSEGKITNVVVVLHTLPAPKASAKGMEELLKERLALLEAVDAKLYGVDLEGTCLFINTSAARMLGYRPEELVGKQFHEVMHAQSCDGSASKWEACPAYSVMYGESEVIQSKQRLLTRDGELIPVEFSATPIVIGNKTLGAVVSITELTERERATEAQLRLETIINSVDEAIITHTLDGIITSWNRSAERIYGYSEDEVLGRHVSIIHPPGLKQELTELFERVGRRNKVDTFETLRIRKGGSRLHVAITVAPIANADGEVVSISQIARYVGQRNLEPVPDNKPQTSNRRKYGRSSEGEPAAEIQRLADPENQFEPAAKSARPISSDLPAKHERGQSVVLIGKSPSILKVSSTIGRIAPTDSSVLITGATGTGKELVARAIHERSQRAEGPFVDINCSAIPETLIEAELFGHQRGTFTGAHENRAGLFEIASGGTLFLDEIDALNLSAQAKLLRAIQERRVRRIGGRTNITVDVRIISATNCDLTAAVNEGRFRADLFYRLRVVPLHVPELCQREGDVELLIEHFLNRYAERYRVPARRFTPEAQQALLEYPWPGNVRELENAIEYALALSDEGDLKLEDLPSEMANGSAKQSSEELSEVLEAYITGSVPLAEIERRYILSVLQHFGGNQVRAAAALGIDRSKLYRRLKLYGIKAVRFLQEERDGMQLLSSRKDETGDSISGGETELSHRTASIGSASSVLSE